MELVDHPGARSRTHPFCRQGEPALLVASGEPFAPWWSGDDCLDAVQAAPTAAAAAVVLVGADRATRPVVRALARSLLGPGGTMQPGACANLFPMSVVAAIDPSIEPAPGAPTAEATGRLAPDGLAPDGLAPDGLAPDDLAAVLGAAAELGASTRRAHLDVYAREALRRLLRGASRRRRRDLGIALVRDGDGRTDRVVRLLDEAARVAYLDAFEPPTPTLTGLIEHLAWVLAHYRVPSRRAPLAGARDWRGSGDIDAGDGLTLRVPWNREQLEREAEVFRNCLGGYYRHVEFDRALVVTVRERRQPLAVAEVGPGGTLRQLLGVDDEEVSLPVRRRVVDALRRRHLLTAPQEPEPLVGQNRVAARVACRAAVLLVDELEPSDPSGGFWASSHEYGDRTLALLGPAADLLRAEEYDRIRGTVVEEVGSEAGWRHVGAMLVAAGERDEALLRMDGRAPFRRAAREAAEAILHGTRRLVADAPDETLRLLRDDPTLPAWQRDAVTEVLVEAGV